MLHSARPVLLALLALAGACRSPDGGLARGYAQPPDMVSRVAAQLLLELGCSIESDTHGDERAQIVARGPATERRTIVACVRVEEPGQTTVRLDVDQRDRRFGEQLLDLISSRVGEETARHPPVVRTSLEGLYDGTLDEGLDALEVALEDAGATVVERVVQPNGARVEARTPDNTVFEVAIVSLRDALSVQFTASAENKERADRRAEELKSDFRRVLTSAR